MGRWSSPTSHTLLLLGLGLGLGSPPPPASSCVRACVRERTGCRCFPPSPLQLDRQCRAKEPRVRRRSRSSCSPPPCNPSDVRVKKKMSFFLLPFCQSVSQSVSHTTGHFRHVHPHDTSLHQLTVRPHLAIGRPARRLHPSMSIDGLLGCRPTSIGTKKFIIF